LVADERLALVSCQAKLALLCHVGYSSLGHWG
jgi:hypothetical protein